MLGMPLLTTAADLHQSQSTPTSLYPFHYRPILVPDAAAHLRLRDILIAPAEQLFVWRAGVPRAARDSNVQRDVESLVLGECYLRLCGSCAPAELRVLRARDPSDGIFFSHPQPSEYAPSSLSHSHQRSLSSPYGHPVLPPFSHTASQYELVKLEDEQYTVRPVYSAPVRGALS